MISEILDIVGGVLDLLSVGSAKNNKNENENTRPFIYFPFVFFYNNYGNYSSIY